MLFKSDFEKAADKIAEQFVAAGESANINQLAKKVAADNNLNPDQIRTMVRLANVSVFGKLFSTKTGSDKDIKFETGDAEVVINSLYDDAKGIKVGSTIPDYERTLDYYLDLNPVEQVKLAAATPEPVSEIPPCSKPELVMQLKRASDKFRMEGKQAEQRWRMHIDTATAMYKNTYGMKTAECFPTFEKNALATDTDVALEVQTLRSTVLREKVAGYSPDELTAIQEKHLAYLDKDARAIFGYIKTASEARQHYEHCQKCVAEVEKGLKALA